jgi:hypothetical protein
VEKLLSVFDEVRVKHEEMEAEAFNNDATYKLGIDEVK